ncbi:hypothetical protein ACFC3F_06645 [Microbacterium sp. NPDC055910]|uniref:hypothetical protein n=1 Tax=Microbacterium sp. NPDC055910 TaxID=3345659 RepID=UPI0035E2B96C
MTSIKVSCATGHKRSTVARFGTRGTLGEAWPTVNANGEPVNPRPFWGLQGASEAIVKASTVQPYLPFDGDSHDTLTLQCPRCALSLQVRQSTMNALLAPFADRGDTRIALADLIAAASPGSN